MKLFPILLDETGEDTVRDALTAMGTSLEKFLEERAA